MKHLSFRSLIFLLVLFGGINLTACKNKAKDTPATTTNVDSNNANAGPPEISSDATLQLGAKDATKDYPGVTTTVSNGEVTLTGNIERDKLASLLQSINALNPKKVHNQLTYK